MKITAGIAGRLDLSAKTPEVLGRRLRALQPTAEQVAEGLELAATRSEETVYAYIRGTVSTETSRTQFLDEVGAMFERAQALPGPSRRMMMKGVMDEVGRAGGLFFVQKISLLTQADARKNMRDFLDAGGGASDVAQWLQLAGGVLREHNIKASGTAGAVVDALGDAAEWVVDRIEDGVDAILEGIDAIIDAVTDAGAALVDLFEEVAEWTADQIGDLLVALIEAGRELGEFVAAAFNWAYAAVSVFVEAAFEVGFTIADLLETVVSETYWVLRRFVNGIIANAGPVGEILDFILTQAENAVSELWRQTLLALRFAEARLEDVLDWMAEQTAEVVEAIIRAWESIGEALVVLYEWALEAGAAVWTLVGEATATLRNSIYYVYNFLTTSGVEFIFEFTRGLIRAGIAIGRLIGWALERTVKVLGEVLRAALDTGQTLGQLLAAVVSQPGNAVNAFVEAAQEIGQTLDDLFEAAVKESAEELLDQLAVALLETGSAVVDILEAALRLGAASLALVVSQLLNLLGSFRSLNADELADARTVFGESLDYDLIFLSTEDRTNKIIFGIQDLFSGNPNSRAFVTSNLINFDPADGPIDRPTLIHELTHVWQHRHEGGIYIAEAIRAQALGAGVGGDAYNYGYAAEAVQAANLLDIQDLYNGAFTPYAFLGDIMGMGGEPALTAPGVDFSSFNPEQQGQIIMHWFVRSQLPIRDRAGATVTPNTAAWDPYQRFVASA